MSTNIQEIFNQNGVIIRYIDYRFVTIEQVDINILSPSEQSTIKTFKSDKRKLEFYYLRLLWRSFNQEQTILYRPSGKPYLTKGYISMTHSHQQAIIAYSQNFDVGVDIELISEKINKVQHKFLHPKDTFKSLEDLTLLWTIKEAVYKLFDGDDLFFMDDIWVENHMAFVLKNNQQLTAITQSFKLNDDFIVTLATEK